jgi:hypothetical protein
MAAIYSTKKYLIKDILYWLTMRNEDFALVRLNHWTWIFKDATEIISHPRPDRWSKLESEAWIRPCVNYHFWIKFIFSLINSSLFLFFIKNNSTNESQSVFLLFFKHMFIPNYSDKDSRDISYCMSIVRAIYKSIHQSKQRFIIKRLLRAIRKRCIIDDVIEK